MKRFFIMLIILIYSLTLNCFCDDYTRFSYALMEGSTDTLLYSENGSMTVPPKHSAKLMTLLLACEYISSGNLSLENTVKVSEHANSMPDPQIWLRAGESIAVSELIMAGTVSNANDACVALCEAVSGNEADFVSLMNSKAKELGMIDTYYADCTGISDESYTTACDIAIVASELSKYDWLDEYFKTYITYVRNGQTQLVNTNRLIRSYEPCTGMKYYYSDETGHCVVASARRDGLTLICVILGEQDKDNLFKTVREKFGIGFSAYVMYQPKSTDVFCEPVEVKHGVAGVVKTEVGKLHRFVVRKSKIENIKIFCEYYEDITAPIKVGDTVGRVIYSIDGEEVYSAHIVSSEQSEKLTFWKAFVLVFKEIVKM